MLLGISSVSVIVEWYASDIIFIYSNFCCFILGVNMHNISFLK